MFYCRINFIHYPASAFYTNYKDYTDAIKARPKIEG
jgi:hypothetical protein